jgi:hypothetical protein
VRLRTLTIPIGRWAAARAGWRRARRAIGRLAAAGGVPRATPRPRLRLLGCARWRRRRRRRRRRRVAGPAGARRRRPEPGPASSARGPPGSTPAPACPRSAAASPGPGPASPEGASPPAESAGPAMTDFKLGIVRLGRVAGKVSGAEPRSGLRGPGRRGGRRGGQGALVRLSPARCLPCDRLPQGRRARPSGSGRSLPGQADGVRRRPPALPERSPWSQHRA